MFNAKKGVYQYSYINTWKRLNETLLPDKKQFHSSLNMEDITDADYNAKRVWKNFEIKKLKHGGHYRCWL